MLDFYSFFSYNITKRLRRFFHMKTTVEIPKKAIKANGYVYITTEKVYHKDKGYNVNRRMCIGKMTPDGKKMEPNNNYYRVFDKANAKPDAPKQSSALLCGNKILIDNIVNNYGIRECLDDFEQESVDKMLDLATYMINKSSSSFQHFNSYAFNHMIFSKQPYTDVEISKFLTTDEYINKTIINQFLRNWAERFVDKDEEIYVSYDSTNINIVSEGVTICEKGRAKDDSTRPQVNLEYAIRSKDGIPLTYESYPGSIIDMVQCSKMVKSLANLNYKNLTLVCDRGYISTENIRLMDKNKYNFILLMKDNLKASKWITKEYAAELKDNYAHYIDEHDVYALTVTQDLFEMGKKRYFHLFFSEELKLLEQKTLYATIKNFNTELENDLESKKIINVAEYNRLLNYFDVELTKKHTVKSFSKNIEKINEKIATLGYYLLVSSKNISAKEAYEAYHSRDIIEKTFRLIKSNLGSDTLGTETNNSTQNKLFIIFLATIILSYMKLQTKPLRQSNKKDFTLPAIINELEKIESFYDPALKEQVTRYKLTAKQKKIYACFGIKENQLDDLIN